MKILYRITFLIFLFDIIGRVFFRKLFVEQNSLIWGWLIILSFLLSFCFIQTLILRLSTNENIKVTNGYLGCFSMMLFLSIFIPALVSHTLFKVSGQFDQTKALDLPIAKLLSNANTLEEKEMVASLVFKETGIAISYMSFSDGVIIYSPTKEDNESRKSSLEMQEKIARTNEELRTLTADNSLLLLIKLIIFLVVTLAVIFYHRNKLTNALSGQK
ncbi:hypothetical protein [Glaciecola petra]|uniref:Uncharacterized protein n=1 Tax=Glaciecola petra TaxID=3075602 RepID=A0ABU2ZZ19_9ALTE|nr:hypothetical protein [Aestuariibacter sp. P117]MDT0596677.1 hypothetical protein [Aestuariibacter sp. P117]